MNKDLMHEAGFDKEVKRVEHGFCPICSKPISGADFRDDLSRKEYKISGLCQKCQDDIFKEEEEG